MKSFNELIDTEIILEFANISPKDHKFGVDVKLHLMQPGKKLQHGPRMKIYRKGIQGDFSISINDNPKVIGNWNNFVSKRELNLLITNVKFYKESLLKFWNDSRMDTNELINLMRNQDK